MQVESASEPGGEWAPRAVVTADRSDLAWMDEQGTTAQVYRLVSVDDPSPFLSLQAALDAARRNQGIVGAVAAAVVPGSGFWIGTSGYSHGTVPVRPYIRFEVASVTKTLVAAATLRLVEEGVLTLDDTIEQWLPDLDHPQINSSVTLRQLLNHRAGIYNFGDNNPFRQALFSDWDRVWTPTDVLAYVEAPYFQAGTAGQYSNTGYVLAGMMIRRASPVGVPAELRRTVFDPAGMNSSFLGVEEGWTGDLAHPHLDFNGDGIHEDLGADSQTAILSSFWTSGAVISTAADLARFGEALFDGTLLNPASLDAMTQVQPVDIGETDYDYGLGLMRFVINGAVYYAHSGGLFGQYSWFSYCPATGASLGIVYNYPQVESGPSFPASLILALDDIAPAPGLPAPTRRSEATGPELRIPWPEHMLRPLGR